MKRLGCGAGFSSDRLEPAIDLASLPEQVLIVWGRQDRWIPAAMEGGDSIWITKSTAPMSMPNSSDDVATMAGSSPRFSRSSMDNRASRATEP